MDDLLGSVIAMIILLGLCLPALVLIVYGLYLAWAWVFALVGII